MPRKKKLLLPDVIEIHQIGSVMCPPCNIAKLSLQKLSEMYPDKLKYKYIDSVDYKINPEYKDYRVEYTFIPKLYIIIDKNPIFLHPNILQTTSIYIVNYLYLYLADVERDAFKGLLQELNIQSKQN